MKASLSTKIINTNIVSYHNSTKTIFVEDSILNANGIYINYEKERTLFLESHKTGKKVLFAYMGKEVQTNLDGSFDCIICWNYTGHDEKLNKYTLKIWND